MNLKKKKTPPPVGEFYPGQVDRLGVLITRIELGVRKCGLYVMPLHKYLSSVRTPIKAL